MAVDPEIQGFLDLLAASEPASLDGPDSAPKLRATYDILMVMLGAGPESVSVEDGAVSGPSGDVPIRIYRPADIDRPGVLVYFHGGGFVIGNVADSERDCRLMADEAGCAVVSVDYRLAPEHPYPAAPEDCYAALSWVADHGGELGLDVSRLAVGGDSAGGNLAAGVSLRARDEGGPAVGFQLLVYPVVDMRVPPAQSPYESMHTNATGYFLEQRAMDWFERCYLPDRTLGAEVGASPIMATTLTGLPPALVMTCEFDPLRDQGEAFAKALADAGVDVTLSRYDGAIHGLFSMALTSGIGRSFMDEATAALRTALA
jgi:acetyl esterase/lipase